MKKKFIISLLTMVVFAGLVLFVYNQVGAQPSAVEDCQQCPDGDLGFTELNPGGPPTVYYCAPGDVLPGVCQCSNWQTLTFSPSYVCRTDENGNKLDCRLVTGNSDGSGCGSFTRCFPGWPCAR